MEVGTMELRMMEMKKIHQLSNKEKTEEETEDYTDKENDDAMEYDDK